MTEDYGTATWRYWQKILNDAGARPSFQDRPPMPARARVEWEHDGMEGVDGTATRLGFDGAIRGAQGPALLNAGRVAGP